MYYRYMETCKHGEQKSGSRFAGEQLQSRLVGPTGPLGKQPNSWAVSWAFLSFGSPGSSTLKHPSLQSVNIRSKHLFSSGAPAEEAMTHQRSGSLEGEDYIEFQDTQCFSQHDLLQVLHRLSLIFCQTWVVKATGPIEKWTGLMNSDETRYFPMCEGGKGCFTAAKVYQRTYSEDVSFLHVLAWSWRLVLQSRGFGFGSILSPPLNRYWVWCWGSVWFGNLVILEYPPHPRLKGCLPGALKRDRCWGKPYKTMWVTDLDYVRKERDRCLELQKKKTQNRKRSCPGTGQLSKANMDVSILLQENIWRDQLLAIQSTLYRKHMFTDMCPAHSVAAPARVEAWAW